MKKIVCFWCLISCLWLGVAMATPDPIALLQSISDQMLAGLKRERPNLKQDPTIVYRLVNKILVPHADVPGMSRSVLGREAWQNASSADQKAFTSAFKDLVIRTYSSALNAYTDESVEFLPLRGGYEGKTMVEVSSSIVRSDGPSVPVNYRLILVGGVWKLYDLNVEGVSLIQSFQSQFAEEIAQGRTVGEIAKTLKERKVQRSEE